MLDSANRHVVLCHWPGHRNSSLTPHHCGVDHVIIQHPHIAFADRKRTMTSEQAQALCFAVASLKCRQLPQYISESPNTLQRSVHGKTNQGSQESFIRDGRPVIKDDSSVIFTQGGSIDGCPVPLLSKTKASHIVSSQHPLNAPKRQQYNENYVTNEVSPSTEPPSKRSRPNTENRKEPFGEAPTGNFSNISNETIFPSALQGGNTNQSDQPRNPNIMISVMKYSNATRGAEDPGTSKAEKNISSLLQSPSIHENLDFIYQQELSASPSSKATQSCMQILAGIGVLEFLDQDERPTFIIDVSNPINHSPGSQLQLVFANASLQSQETLLELVRGIAGLDSPGIAVTNDFPEFKAWALSFVKNQEALDVSLPSFSYAGMTWRCSTLRKRIRIISSAGFGLTTSFGPLSSAEVQSVSSALPERIRSATGVSNSSTRKTFEPLEPPDYFSDITIIANPNQNENQLTLSSPASININDHIGGSSPTRLPEASILDWTRLPVGGISRHVQFAQSIDWGATPLGPITGWNYDLRAVFNLIMRSLHPAAIYWGDEFTVIYNEAYILIAGQKHPNLMGRPFTQAWAELWNSSEDPFIQAKQFGQATMKDDDQLFIKRHGYLEEAYFSWSVIPLIGKDGTVVGLYNPAFEKTRKKIAERRMLTLREIGERTAMARDLKGFWGLVIEGLAYNEYDIPFALLYSISEDCNSNLSSTNSGTFKQSSRCVLEGTLGVPGGHQVAVSPLDLKTNDDGFAPHLRESMKTGRPVLLTTEDGTLSFHLIEGLQWRGFGDPCRASVVCPIHPTTGEAILGFLVIGVNPRRPYDDDYSLFIQLLSRQIATSMASVVLFEEEIRRSQRAAQLAALDRQELSKQLDLRTQEKLESEMKFSRMAEFAPVGMFIANSAGEITYSNSTWWEISRHPQTEGSISNWMQSIKDEDHDAVFAVWNNLFMNKVPISHEFRYKVPWEDHNGSSGDRWVLMNAYPEKDVNGRLKGIFGSITNISHQKWAEDFQKRRSEEAVEMKRAQTDFIDITSHEMRNPLSAILLCSDEIVTSLTNLCAVEVRSKLPEDTLTVVESGIDAAQTIALCAQHQKRIVDDILSLSKLDSQLLLVTPVDCQPVSIVKRALKMFQAELETNDIDIELRLEKSFIDLGIDWVKLDPSRLLQVLINLTTNAIKFTHTQSRRTIIISVAASRKRPTGTNSKITYFPTRSKRMDPTTNEAEWGSGAEIYLHFEVQDTGPGLDEEEKKVLFQRFSQASPRTHVRYGGSGLGLFISRELTEMQGGEIGVASEKGVGSTFAFYVKAREVDNIPQENMISPPLNAVQDDSPNYTVPIESRRNSYGKISQRSNTIENFSKQIQGNFNYPVLDYSKLRVLIVEDNLVNQRVLQKQLDNIGFLTKVANHGGEALDALRLSTFWAGKENDGMELSVILMDLEMPVMNGLVCTRTIRKLQAEKMIVKHVPIIAATANARLEQIESAKSAGMLLSCFVSGVGQMQHTARNRAELMTSGNALSTLTIVLFHMITVESDLLNKLPLALKNLVSTLQLTLFFTELHLNYNVPGAISEIVTFTFTFTTMTTLSAVLHPHFNTNSGLEDFSYQSSTQGRNDSYSEIVDDASDASSICRSPGWERHKRSPRKRKEESSVPQQKGKMNINYGQPHKPSNRLSKPQPSNKRTIQTPTFLEEAAALSSRKARSTSSHKETDSKSRGGSFDSGIRSFINNIVQSTPKLTEPSQMMLRTTELSASQSGFIGGLKLKLATEAEYWQQKHDNSYHMGLHRGNGGDRHASDITIKRFDSSDDEIFTKKKSEKYDTSSRYLDQDLQQNTTIDKKYGDCKYIACSGTVVPPKTLETNIAQVRNSPIKAGERIRNTSKPLYPEAMSQKSRRSALLNINKPNDYYLAASESKKHCSSSQTSISMSSEKYFPGFVSPQDDSSATLLNSSDTKVTIGAGSKCSRPGSVSISQAHVGILDDINSSLENQCSLESVLGYSARPQIGMSTIGSAQATSKECNVLLEYFPSPSTRIATNAELSGFGMRKLPLYPPNAGVRQHRESHNNEFKEFVACHSRLQYPADTPTHQVCNMDTTKCLTSNNIDMNPSLRRGKYGSTSSTGLLQQIFPSTMPIQTLPRPRRHGARSMHPEEGQNLMGEQLGSITPAAASSTHLNNNNNRYPKYHNSLMASQNDEPIAKIYECMANPDGTVKDEELGVSGQITAMVKCPWCLHGMSKECCAAYVAIVAAVEENLA
ncbi:hypothetical protein B7463_g3087, partial [Scytalidium lignicola]